MVQEVVKSQHLMEGLKMSEIKGWHVFSGFATAFGIIIFVNLTLAYNAIKTFPGLEVKNSYIASQSFDKDRFAQKELNWVLSAHLKDNTLSLKVLENGRPISPIIIDAVFGRATNILQDQKPEFIFNGSTLKSKVIAGSGNWNLRLKLKARDGTLFQQRITLGES